MDPIQKTWWAPIWRGLVVDPLGKHYRRLGKALWLLLYLILHANRKTGITIAKLATIEKQTGIPRRTLQRWLRSLRANGYVSTTPTGRATRIGILKWKNTKRPAPSSAADAPGLAQEVRRQLRMNLRADR